MRTVRNAWLLVVYALLNFGLLTLVPISVMVGFPLHASPLLVPVLSVVVAGGPWALAAVYLGSVATLARLGPWVLGLVMFSAFFWIDLLAETFFTPVAAAVAFALAGSRVGALVFLALALLMPTPVTIPLAAWLLWRTPEVRVPFAAMTAISAIGLALSGQALGWLSAVVLAATEAGPGSVIGLGVVFGPGWLVVGIPIAAVMVWRGSGRVAALAGLVVAPYLLPQYLLLAVVALAPRRAWQREPSREPAPSGASWYAGAQVAYAHATHRIVRVLARRGGP